MAGAGVCREALAGFSALGTGTVRVLVGALVAFVLVIFVSLIGFWHAGCPKGGFQCGDGRCLARTHWCDGLRDCPGGDDEDEQICLLPRRPRTSYTSLINVSVTSCKLCVCMASGNPGKCQPATQPASTLTYCPVSPSPSPSLPLSPSLSLSPSLPKSSFLPHSPSLPLSSSLPFSTSLPLPSLPRSPSLPLSPSLILSQSLPPSIPPSLSPSPPVLPSFSPSPPLPQSLSPSPPLPPAHHIHHKRRRRTPTGATGWTTREVEDELKNICFVKSEMRICSDLKNSCGVRGVMVRLGNNHVRRENSVGKNNMCVFFSSVLQMSVPNIAGICRGKFPYIKTPSFSDTKRVLKLSYLHSIEPLCLLVYKYEYRIQFNDRRRRKVQRNLSRRLKMCSFLVKICEVHCLTINEGKKFSSQRVKYRQVMESLMAQMSRQEHPLIYKRTSGNPHPHHNTHKQRGVAEEKTRVTRSLARQTHARSSSGRFLVKCKEGITCSRRLAAASTPQ